MELDMESGKINTFLIIYIGVLEITLVIIHILTNCMAWLSLSCTFVLN